MVLKKNRTIFKNVGNSLHTKITVTTLAIVFIAISALGGFNYWKARGIILNTINENIGEKAENSAMTISDWLEIRREELRIMALSPELQSGDKQVIAHYLEKMRAANQLYTSIGIVFPDGSYANSNGNAGKQDYFDSFKDTLNGEEKIFDPIVSKASGHFVTTISLPVKSGNGIIGAIYGAIDMEAISNKVKDIKVGKTGFAYVMQSDGLVAIHPDNAIAMKRNLLNDPNISEQKRTETARMANSEKGILLDNWEGIKKYTAYASVPGLNWKLCITVPVAEVTESLHVMLIISTVIILIVMIVAASAIALITRRIIGPLHIMVRDVEEVAAGNLTARNRTTSSQDEIGKLDNAMVTMRSNLNHLIRQVKGATDQLAASSEELTASTEQSAQAVNQVAEVISEVAGGAAKQLKAVDDTAAIFGQISVRIQQIAANANNVADTSAKSSDTAQKGKKVIAKAVSKMEDIEKTVSLSSGTVSKLGERSKEIVQIIDAITQITSQTSLLAFNAAIEAARAGEQGRGFAVVADEIRKLAEQSQEAAKQIAKLIADIQQDTDSAVRAMGEGAREVRLGTEVVNEAGQTFQEIFEAIDNVSNQTREISDAIERIAADGQQVMSAVNEIETVSKATTSKSQTVSAATQEQSATMEEISSLSQSLSKMAEKLQNVIHKFKV